MSFADSTLHLCILWRLRRSWLLAVPPKSGTPVDLFSFNPGDRALPIWNMDESNHRHLSISTQIYQARRVWVPVCWITHGILLDDHVCPQLSWHEIPIRTRFGKQNRLRDTGGGVISVVGWSEEPNTGDERESASFGQSCKSKLLSSWEPWENPGHRVNALEQGSLDTVQSHILMSSSRSLSWFRGQSFQILCECDRVPHCDGKRHQHRWGAAAADVSCPFNHQTTCLTAVATRAATVKYRTTSTSIALSWNF